MTGFGAAAKDVVQGLSSQPIVLALVVISLMLAGLLYYQSAIFNAQRQANVALFVEVQKETQKLLSQCIIPAPQGRQQSILRLPLPKVGTE